MIVILQYTCHRKSVHSLMYWDHIDLPVIYDAVCVRQKFSYMNAENIRAAFVDLLNKVGYCISQNDGEIPYYPMYSRFMFFIRFC